MIDRMILLWYQLRQKRCERCGLPQSDNIDSCPHCSHLSDSELNQFFVDNNIDYGENKSSLPFFVFAGIVIVIIYILSKILKT